MLRDVPLYTLDGVPNADISIHRFSTKDRIGLTLTRFLRETSADPVLVIHGLTTSSDMFIMPEHENLVQTLHQNGFGDVFCLDYRMSNHFPYNLTPHRFTMDDIALYDFPAALEEMRRITGTERVHVIAHCLGSVSFLMSLFGEAVHNVTSVIANSVGLTPRVPNWSKVKLVAAPFLVEKVLQQPYLSPDFRAFPSGMVGNLFGRAVDLAHRECDESACHMLSMMWGSGFPALYAHENLDPITHRRSGDLYGATGLHYYRHVRKMVFAGRAVKYDPRNAALNQLPDDYTERVSQVQTPVLLATGSNNRVFADSNVVCAALFERLAPSRHQLIVVPGYGHQDIFMGKRVSKEVFPAFIRFLHAHTDRKTLAVVPSSIEARGSARDPNLIGGNSRN